MGGGGHIQEEEVQPVVGEEESEGEVVARRNSRRNRASPQALVEGPTTNPRVSTSPSLLHLLDHEDEDEDDAHRGPLLFQGEVAFPIIRLI